MVYIFSFFLDDNVDVIYICPLWIGEDVTQYYMKLLGLQESVKSGKPEAMVDMTNRLKVITPEATIHFTVCFPSNCKLFYGRVWGRWIYQGMWKKNEKRNKDHGEINHINHDLLNGGTGLLCSTLHLRIVFSIYLLIICFLHVYWQGQHLLPIVNCLNHFETVSKLKLDRELNNLEMGTLKDHQ